jgi:hypothetical protein
VWASVFYRGDPRKQERSRRRFHPEHSAAERFRHRLQDLVGGAHDAPLAGVAERVR